MSPQPSLLAERFAKAMQALAVCREKPVAIAFSGGGDSLALLALACDYTPPGQVHALIVDHALRPQSGLEASKAAAMAVALGAQAQVLLWDKPRPGQNHARTARYALLAKACRDVGANTLYLAHTQDDQEETFIMRLARGSTARGLACMAKLSPYPLWPEGRDLQLSRPLLNVRRADLRHWLTHRALDWIEDPSNQNRDYTRVRARQKLAAFEAAGLAAGRIAKSVYGLRQLEAFRRQQASALLDNAVHFHPAGYALVSKSFIAATDNAVLHTALFAVLAGVSGNHRAHVSEAVSRKIIQRICTKAFKSFTAAGCLLSSSEGDVLVCRDPGAVLGRGTEKKILSMPVQKGQSAIFDGRFEITVPLTGRIETLGVRARALPKPEHQRLMGLPAVVRPLIPIILGECGALSSPILGGAGCSVFLGQEIMGQKLAPFSHKGE